MREILFKAKRVDNGEWLEGYGVCVIPNSNLASILHFQGNNLMNITGVIPETVCQFTGLIDKNGNRIFHGDRMKGMFFDRGTSKAKKKELEFTVEFDSIIGFFIDCSEYGDYRFFPHLEDCEITGNIHDDANKQ